MASAASSSSSASPLTKQYDVFISFRGEDTRRGFTSHLYAALLRKQIRTYKDDRNIEKGEKVWSALVEAIDNSYLCIVVFSKDYASSTWCLRELTHIIECEKKVIPVFYEIDPSHVRKQSASYDEAFQQHQKNPKLDKKEIKKWRDSLEKASDLSGFHSESPEYRDDDQLIMNIAEDVWQKLKHIYPPSEPKGLVGNFSNIELLFQEFQTIGFWGIGGIGKTTVARILFSKYSYQYEGHCFLEDVRENSGRCGLHNLRDKLLSKLFKGDAHNFDVEPNMVESRLSRMRVFIVLDDVDTSQQIECLANDIKCFGSNSRIIITTRDKQVLNGRVDKIHEVEGLDYQKSIELFYLKAFDKGHVQMGFKDLSIKAVDYCKGLPLALILLGSFLRNSSEEVWEETLEKLKSHPFRPMNEVLKLSYNGLEDEEKEIFLDIAFFFKGEKKVCVQNFLKACKFCAATGLEVLENKALITISNGIVEMHDRIQEMGWEVVQEQCINDLGRRSRLRNPMEIHDVLKNDKGSNAIEGILLDLSYMIDLHLSGDPFKNMTKLRYIKFCYNTTSSKMIIDLIDGNRFCQVYPSSQPFFDRLKYFCWNVYMLKSLSSILCFEKVVLLDVQYSRAEGYPSHPCRSTYYNGGIFNILRFNKLEEFLIKLCFRWPYVPAIFCAKNFVRFVMHDDHITKLWDGVQNLVNLKEINLSGCRNLIELPDLTKAVNLELIDLSYCERLDHVPTNFCFRKLVPFVMKRSGCKKLWDGVQNLVSLKEINLSGCRDLIELLDLTKAVNLELIDLSYCEGLDHVPTNFCFRKLVRFVMKRSGCKKLWDGVQNLESLKEINLSGCRDLIELPDLTKAVNLELIDLSYCEGLDHVPTNSCFGKLVRFVMQRSGCKKLWDGVQNLESLEEINLSGSEKLIEVPDFSKASKLRVVHLDSCEILRQVHPSLLSLQSLYELHLSGCINLESLQSGTALDNLSLLNLAHCSSLTHFSLSSMTIQTLDLSETAIEMLDSSIGRCSNLQSLNLYCSSIKSLPNELSNLGSLKTLNLGKCRKLDTWNLHIILEGLRDLRNLCLQESNVECLPACIKYLSFLQFIDISDCKRLQSIPGLPLSYNELKANDCTCLKTVEISASTSTILDVGITFLWDGLRMSFKNCRQFDESSTNAIESDAHRKTMVAAACQCDHPIEFCFPGKVPVWFKYHKRGSLITIELPPDSEPLGFAFSLVLHGYSLCDGTFYYVQGIECNCSLEDSDIVISKSQEFSWYPEERSELYPDHVILWYDETNNEAIMKAIRESRAKHTSYNPKLSFQFSVCVARNCGRKLEKAIKECGVWPIDASEIEYSAKDMDLILEIGSPRDRPTKKLKPSFRTRRLELE